MTADTVSPKQGTAYARQVPLHDSEFRQFQALIYEIAGIHLSDAKKALVCGRLAKRLGHHGFDSYSAYLRLLGDANQTDELQTAVDLLTTNETYFFRESKHFSFLTKILPLHREPGRPYRIWSAACSTGAEPYSIAMLLADRLGEISWSVLGSDISTQVLDRARSGHYPLAAAQHIPPAYLSAYCLKGVRSQADTLLVQRRLRTRVDFRQINLNTALPALDPFDVIFLRNVLIYFDAGKKREVVGRILTRLRPGGYIMVGHSESLFGVAEGLETVAPSIYRKT